MGRFKYLTIMILGIMALTSVVIANYPRQTKGAVSVTDRKFVDDITEGGMAEIKLGELARDKASNQEVKNFAQKMIDDHTKAGDQLKQLANQKSITVPGDVNAQDKATMERLSKLSGRAFDRAYMDEMVKGHQKVVAAFHHEISMGKDTDVKGWASKTLPTIEEHLKMARTTYAKVSPAKKVMRSKKAK